MYEPSLPAVVWPSGASCTRLRSDASVSYIAFVVEVSAVINWRFRFFSAALCSRSIPEEYASNTALAESLTC
ncbi:hypothetical protein D3C71_1195100 [compost metagenome]